MLQQFWNLNKYGIKRTRVIYTPTSSFGLNPKGFGDHMGVNRFKYKHFHPYLCPTLYNDMNGDRILVGHGKVHPKTTINDVVWVRPKRKISTKIFHEFKSSSSDVIYKTTEIIRDDGTTYTCNCRGYFMKKDKKEGCTHIQKVRKSNQE